MFDAQQDDHNKDDDTTSSVFTEELRPAMTLYLAACSYAKKGGTLPEFREVMDRVIKEFWNGEDAEAKARVPGKGQLFTASPSSPIAGGRDQIADAKGAVAQGRSPVVPPVREPSEAQRKAAASVAKVIALTILDTFRIDGRPVGDWSVSEAIRATKLKTREAFILKAAVQTVANPQGNELLRQVVKPAEMEAIIKKSEDVSNDAA